MILGVRPWKDVAYFYSLMAAMLASLVIFTVISEFVRGGHVISRHTGFRLVRLDASPVAPQYAPLRRLHRPLRRRGRNHRHPRHALQSRSRKRNGLRRQDESRARTRWSASPTRRTTTPTTATSGRSSMSSRATSRSRRCIPSAALYKASSQPQTIPRIYPTYAQDLFLVNDLVHRLRRP